jgi:N-acetylglutamate synthase-like GNAT family acetyltransferase
MFTIRPATADDQRTIRSIVYAARLNPLSLHWPAFMVAEEARRIVGIGQVKAHRDGSRELASIAVLPEHQSQGIASEIIAALVAKESGPLYLMCLEARRGFYARFGFREVPASELPTWIRLEYRLGRLSTRLMSLVERRRYTLIAMKREASSLSFRTLHGACP